LKKYKLKLTKSQIIDILEALLNESAKAHSDMLMYKGMKKEEYFKQDFEDYEKLIRLFNEKISE